MHPHDDEPAAGWLTCFRRGIGSGAALFVLALICCIIPAFAVWLIPGGDTTPISTALKAGALLVLSGTHGGVVLHSTLVTLTPVLVSLGIAWLFANQARRADNWSTVAGSTVGYALAAGVVAAWARLGDTHAPIGRSMLAAWLFTVAVGSVARALDGGWSGLGARYQRLIRAAGAVTASYVALGSALSAVMLVSHFSTATDVQRQLAPGAAGLPIALLGIAATPNAVLAGIGYLLGPGLHVGTHNSVSVLTAQHGPLPTFPLLGALPQGGPAVLLGTALIAIAALVAGGLATRLVTGSWLARLRDCALAAVLSGGTLAVLSAFASGGLGAGALHRVGEVWWQVGAMTIVLVPGAAGCWLLAETVRAWLAGRSAAGGEMFEFPVPPSTESQPPAPVETSEPTTERRRTAG